MIEHDRATAALLRYCLNQVLNRPFSIGPRLLLSTPSDITPLEARAVRVAARMAGTARTSLLEEAVASALGAEIAAERTRASVVVDIGADTTDIAVVSQGELVQGRTLRRGSSMLDQAILHYLRQERGIETSAENAERIKLELATLKPEQPPAQIEIRGRKLATRLPEFVTVTSAEVRTVIEPVILNLINFIHASLEELPLKASLDLLDTGIVLSGGGAPLPGLTDRLAEELKLGVWLSATPQRATIYGLGRLLEKHESTRSQSFLIKQFSCLGTVPRRRDSQLEQAVHVQAIDERQC